MWSLVFFAAGALGGLSRHKRAVIDYNSAPPNLSTLANGSLFETWRPRAHILPPFGQIGDPVSKSIVSFFFPDSEHWGLERTR